jgi:hypothetical protein
VFKSIEDIINEGLEDKIQYAMKNVVTRVIKMDHDFKCETMEGIVVGKAGDYLAVGKMGEVYPINSKVFQETYDIIDESKTVSKDELKDAIYDLSYDTELEERIDATGKICLKMYAEFGIDMLKRMQRLAFRGKEIVMQFDHNHHSDVYEFALFVLVADGFMTYRK